MDCRAASKMSRAVRHCSFEHGILSKMCGPTLGLVVPDPMGEPISDPLLKATGWPWTLPALGLTGAELGTELGTEPMPSDPLSKFSGCP